MQWITSKKHPTHVSFAQFNKLTDWAPSESPAAESRAKAICIALSISPLANRLSSWPWDSIKFEYLGGVTWKRTISNTNSFFYEEIFTKIVGNLWNGFSSYISIEGRNYSMPHSLNKSVVKMSHKLIFRVLDFSVSFEMGFTEPVLFVDWFSWTWRLFLFGLMRSYDNLLLWEVTKAF